MKVFLAIPSSRFGEIIGKGGATIRQLEADSGADVSVPRRSAQVQVVGLAGEAGAVARCRTALEKLLGERYPECDAQGAPVADEEAGEEEGAPEARGEHEEEDARPPSEDEVRAVFGGDEPHWGFFLVEKHHHGRLVGPRGATVRRLEQECGVKFKIPRRADAEVAVRVFGSCRQLLAASEAMERVLGFPPQPAPLTKAMRKEPVTTQQKAEQKHDNDRSHVERLYVPHSCFYELIGKEGRTVRGIEERENVKIRIPKKGEHDLSVRVYGSNAECVKDACDEIEEVLGFAPSRTPITGQFVQVDPSHFSTIIGRGGQTLERLERDTGCNIVVPRRGASEQRVLLEGNQESIDAALKALDELGVGAKPTGSHEDAEHAIEDDIAEPTEVDVPSPTPQEIGSLPAAAERLWELDHGRLTLGRDFFVDKRARGSDHFFDRIEPDVFLSPTYRALFHLQDNYESGTGRGETVSAQERRENCHFIDMCMNTPVMRYAHEWCVAKGLAPPQEGTFKRMLYAMWFGTYSRSGAEHDSSGFEHVYIGEIKNGKVTGFHNWLQFYLEEKRGDLDYRGYRGGDDHVVSVSFAWEGQEKPVSTIALGVSPEYELALYTMCFLNRQERTRLKMGATDVEIKSYRIRSRYGDKVGTVFPVAK